MSRILNILVLVLLTSASWGRPLVQGTVGGGGGGTITLPTISVQELTEIVNRSRFELYLLLQRQENIGGRHEPFKNLFNSPKSIFTVIKSHSIQNETCRDIDKKPTDGSIHSSVPNTICIDIKGLAAKLDRDSARNQVLSLVAHEYSHLIGFDEATALALQKEIYNLARTATSDSVYVMAVRHQDSYNALARAFIKHGQNTEAPSWNYLCYLTSSIAEYFEQLKKTEQSLANYGMENRAMRLNFVTAYIRLQILSRKSCGESDFHPNRKSYLTSYKNSFGDLDLLPAKAFAKDYEVLPDIYFANARSFQIYLQELAAVESFVTNSRKELAEIHSLAPKTRVVFPKIL